ncbi:hypothetical protein PNK_1078 [Candidatus Protochlamydia naegleriophila]|uniref:Uncharacterized protein n=1 Tax=Candidatus Protochlamydia naegleriophila TaxID=389348 RepID=A0A0U5JC45_9BACT|nr:hypothetical protein [Candidatus Protochlamydia naegleriophila]CUI16695.1 hypothetical protein PNK_1078 [Candidatus Protochlamydia naegleriophila]
MLSMSSVGMNVSRYLLSPCSLWVRKTSCSLDPIIKNFAKQHCFHTSLSASSLKIDTSDSSFPQIDEGQVKELAVRKDLELLVTKKTHELVAIKKDTSKLNDEPGLKEALETFHTKLHKAIEADNRRDMQQAGRKLIEVIQDLLDRTLS